MGTFSDAITVILGPLPESLRTTITAPVAGSLLTRGRSATFAWNPLPVVSGYFFEFTGVNRQFANPNGGTLDGVNGLGGAGGGFAVVGTTVTVGVPATIAAGTYQVRVIPLTAEGAPVGLFSDAVPVLVQ